IICSPMTSLKTSIKTITYLSDIGCLEIQGASLTPLWKTLSSTTRFQSLFSYVASGVRLFVATSYIADVSATL
ncbi:hypothetical protein, partial [Escherichia coli]|uniref:hypothetical protein n=1 Tax=Escherichia coli TaxID=562 RepID=UPI001BC8C9F0